MKFGDVEFNNYFKNQRTKQQDIKYYLGFRKKLSKERIKKMNDMKKELTNENPEKTNIKNKKKSTKNSRAYERNRMIRYNNDNMIASRYLQLDLININYSQFDSVRTRLEQLSSYEDITNYISTELREIFMEIDLLGNYTDYSWFENLTREQINLFCIELFDLWMNRLPFNTRTRLQYIPNIQCGNPFLIFGGATYRTTIRNFGNLNSLTSKFILMLVLKQFIFGSTDREKRIQCSMYVLGCLTICSREARESLRWLYENFV